MTLHKKIFLAAGLLAGLALFHLPASAEEPPAPAEPEPFQLPEFTTFSLDNGLDVTLVPYGTVPKVQVMLAVRAGNLNEGQQTWLADLTGDMLEEGTKNLTGKQLAEKIAGMGGSLYVSTGLDQTSIGGDALSEFGPELVATLADVVRAPRLPASEFERVRNDLQRQLQVALTRPQSLALQAFNDALYGDHPYGNVFPTAEQLAGYSLEDVKRFHAENFGAQRTHVYVAGKFDAQAMEQAIRKAFSGWKQGPAVEKNIPEASQKHRLILIDRPGAPQSTLYMGLPVIGPHDEGYTPFSVMNTLLGGSFSSRITSNIREDKGYTYSPRSSIDNQYRSSYWVQSADVTTEHTGDSIREILKEINTLQNNPPAKQELEGFQNYLSGTFVLQNSAPGSILGQLAFMDLHGLPKSWLENYVTRVNAVTPAQVSAAAREQLPEQQFTIVVVGDLAKVRPQLKGLGWIEKGDL